MSLHYFVAADVVRWLSFLERQGDPFIGRYREGGYDELIDILVASSCTWICGLEFLSFVHVFWLGTKMACHKL